LSSLDLQTHKKGPSLQVPLLRWSPFTWQQIGKTPLVFLHRGGISVDFGLSHGDSGSYLAGAFLSCEATWGFLFLVAVSS